jgi:hypothetical protein
MGFDGYQRVDHGQDDPFRPVDDQVAALWSALLHEFGLHYVEPPPTYTQGAQRIRTPSRMLEEGRGTCLDLALLLCSCLEYVGLRPVMFLFRGHAFPGYWRCFGDWEAFTAGMHVLEQDAAGVRRLIKREAEVSGTRRGEEPERGAPWVFGSSRYEELRQQISQGRLVPIESTLLTAHAGFGAALDAGWENMRHASEFEAMYDVCRARSDRFPVTPLPFSLRHRDER